MNQKAQSSPAVDADYMFAPVPSDARRPTWKQVMVWVGFGYVATGLFIGGTLAGPAGGAGVSFPMAMLAIAIGMGILFVLTSLLGVIAQRTGLSLALLCRYAYGAKGMNLPMLAMGLLTLGWFSAITGMVGDIWGAFIGNPSGIVVFDPGRMGYQIAPITLEVFAACLLCGLLFTATSMSGMKGLERLAVPVAPVIMLIAVLVGIGMLDEGGGLGSFVAASSQKRGLPLSSAVTMLVGSWIAGAIMGVDLFRFSRNARAVWLGSAACFLLTNPLLNIVGYIGTVTVGEYNYVSWMLEKSFLLALAGALTWTLSLWTTNDAELYCNALYTGPVLQSCGFDVSKKQLVLVAGLAGTVLGALGFYQMFFSPFINYLGIMAPPLAGPLLADFYIKHKGRYDVRELDQQPEFNRAGVGSALIGMGLGLALELNQWLAVLPNGLVALLATVLLYLLLHPILSAKPRPLAEKAS
ncbi:cytosine permease [Cupriavidus taiwanensis]|nr:cytosine permease [Cupriavidus taiwanensis]